MSEASQYAYSAVADAQLDALETGTNARLYNLVVDTCEGIIEAPGVARERSAVIATDEGPRFRTPVQGAFPFKVFWSLTGDVARIEAVFPYEA